jgi:hypothetical protein
MDNKNVRLKEPKVYFADIYKRGIRTHPCGTGRTAADNPQAKISI